MGILAHSTNENKQLECEGLVANGIHAQLGTEQRMSKEEKFYDKLQDIFVGAKIEGQGGFINLMKIKSRYYGAIKERLEEDIDSALGKHPSFRDELFDRLHSFFDRYFTQNGSIYFNDTAFHNNLYEKVYTNERDIILFWKTQMLYYVKTDSLYRTMPIELDGMRFYFDASKLENKKANEKKGLVFCLKENGTEDVIHFEVTRSENGNKTKKTDEIQKLIKKKKDVHVAREQLERAFSLFERQGEVDYFINKNAESFLKEQFKLWSYQYFWEGAPDWHPDRINQLQILKNIAFKVIDFIAQFEDELVRIWNKPKFVRNAHYVITLDRLSDALQQKIGKANGYDEQVKEWNALDIEKGNPKAPIDTRHFKDLELEILAQFDNLDEVLDGWLIKSENYQALNTILPKFKERVQCVYIDPPFNLNKTADYEYVVNYKDSNWATILENRISLGQKFLRSDGSFFIRCDYNGNWIVRGLMSNILNYQNEIIVSKSAKLTEEINKYHSGHDTLFLYTKSDSFAFSTATKKRDNPQWRPMHLPGIRWSPLPSEYIELFSKSNLKEINGKVTTRARVILGKELLPPEGRHWALSQKSIFELERENKIKWNGNGEPQTKEGETQKLTDNWTDWVGYSSHWGFMTENHEKIIERAITSSSLAERDIVIDFFLGSGTTAAVAHKLNRKWIGIELGEHFYSVILPRMKKVLAYDKTGISKETKQYQGGGFFKYYELEQYEETLNRCKYEDGDIINRTDKSAYEQYVFLPDEKLLDAIESSYETGKVQVNLGKLYSDIDIPETLSNLTGKWIKSITKEKVTFADDIEINIADIDHQSIKPLIWWERK